MSPDIDHPREVTVGQRVVMNRVVKADRQWLRLRFFSIVYLEKRFLPEIQLAES